MPPKEVPPAKPHETGPEIGAGKHLVRSLTLTMCTVAAGMFAFEFAKESVFPRFSKWESHELTIVFSATFTTGTAYFIQRRTRRLVSRVLASESHAQSTCQELAAAYERLEERERQYARITENVPGMVFRLRQRADGHFDLPYASDRCRDLFGFEPAALQAGAAPLGKVLPADDRAELWQVLKTSGHTLEPFQFEGRYLSPTVSDERWIEIAAHPERTPAGDLLWDGVLRDITDRKHFEMNLQAAKEEAEAANRAKNEFLSRVSHELRTPLNAILGFTQLLELSTLSPTDQDHLFHISKAGWHLLNLINEVLDLSRIENGNIALSLAPVNLRRLLGEAMELVRPLAKEIRLAFDETTVSEGFAEYAIADEQRLKQVLLNLLSNAIKYNTPQGSVKISVGSAPEERVRIMVADTGAGIAPEWLGSLFTPFVRLPNASGIEGTGLGLALCKRLVHQMSGELGVESTPGVGSTFWVELSRAQTPVDDSDLHLPIISPEAPTISHRAKILYIEDNLDNLKLIQNILLQRAGVDLLTSIQGAVGCQLAHDHQPDLILLDLHLPDIDGWQVLQKLRREPKTAEIPVVVLSADATTSQIERLKCLGACEYLTKPIRVKEFLGVIDKRLTQGEPEVMAN